MPILARHRWLYPIDWRELSLSIRFRRAKGRCEGCSRPHGREVLHFGDGLWWDEDAGTWRCGKGKRHRRLPPPHSTIRCLDRRGNVDWVLTNDCCERANEIGSARGCAVAVRCLEGF